METIEKTLHFSVEAEVIVDLARDKVLSRDWRGAVRLLTEVMVPPMKLDDAVGILSGKLTIVDTEGGMCLAEQDPECAKFKRYWNTAHWQQAGILERGGEFYQPYAEITSFSREDEKQVITRLRDQEDWCSVEMFRQERARIYMDMPFDDIACFDTGGAPVLMKRVQGPAFWMPTFTDPALAMKHYRKHRKGNLKEISHTYLAVAPASLDFYLEAALMGALTDVDELMPAIDQQMLAKTIKMRAEFDNNPRPEENPWRSNETVFEDAVYAMVWKYRVELQAEKVGGFLEIPVERYRDDAPEVYRVARAPFQIWAQQYGRSKVGVLPEWKVVCPSGLKMGSDNPMHTDWWVSSGLPFRAAYDHEHPLNKAAWKLAYQWQAVEGEKCLKLAGSGKVTGPVVFPKAGEAVLAGSIAVVSHAGPDYELALMSACKNDTGAVIAQVGGKLAHLAIVSRELGARLVVVDEAMTKFKEGELVTLNLDTGEVQIHGRGSDD